MRDEKTKIHHKYYFTRHQIKPPTAGHKILNQQNIESVYFTQTTLHLWSFQPSMEFQLLNHCANICLNDNKLLQFQH